MAHAHIHDGNERRLLAALGVITLFMVVEVVGGLLAGSLALLADAAHMLTDAGALALAWGAQRLAARPAGPRHTYGYDRFKILAAFVNGLSLIVLSVWIVAEAVERLWAPQPVLAGPMLAVALAGLVANLVAFFLLHGASKSELNIRGAMLHVLGDLLGSVAAIAAALIIASTGWSIVDPLLSLLVVVLILTGAVRLVRSSAHILMQGAPPSLDLDAVRRALMTDLTGAEAVHHMHCWMLTDQSYHMTFHLKVADGADPDHVMQAAKELLHRRFDIIETTIQMETGECPDPVRPHPERMSL